MAPRTCPAFVVFPYRIRFAASFRSVCASRITGDLPPSSSDTGVRCFAAAPAIMRPMRPLPV